MIRSCVADLKEIKERANDVIQGGKRGGKYSTEDPGSMRLVLKDLKLALGTFLNSLGTFYLWISEFFYERYFWVIVFNPRNWLSRRFWEGDSGLTINIPAEVDSHNDWVENRILPNWLCKYCHGWTVPSIEWRLAGGGGGGGRLSF